MTSSILCQWKAIDGVGGPFEILPDGCRDLIFVNETGQPPSWMISDLQNETKSAVSAPNTEHFGLRLTPGAMINCGALLDYVRNIDHFDDLGIANIDEFVSVDPNIIEALNALAQSNGSVKLAQKQAGLSARSLQRLLVRTTGQTPSFWTMLARARKSATQVNGHDRLSEIAYEYGFADQAHMTREFRRWFGISPAALRKEPTILEQLNAAGYS